MSGVKWFYISNEGKIFNVPQPKHWVFKPILELANQWVLEVCLYYETKNRKPAHLISISFDRIKLDNKGQYRLTSDETNMKLRDFLEYGFTTAEELSKKTDPWSIPDAPIIPNQNEKDALIQFLKSQYPLLWNGCPQIIEKEIIQKEAIHKKKLELIRRAIKLKKSKRN